MRLSAPSRLERYSSRPGSSRVAAFASSHLLSSSFTVCVAVSTGSYCRAEIGRSASRLGAEHSRDPHRCQPKPINTAQFLSLYEGIRAEMIDGFEVLPDARIALKRI